MPDMREVLEEAWELVEHKIVTRDDFRDFCFTNCASMHLRMNPKFFDGTRVEQQARKLLATLSEPAAAAA
jgi:hypothetical protein